MDYISFFLYNIEAILLYTSVLFFRIRYFYIRINHVCLLANNWE